MPTAKKKLGSSHSTMWTLNKGNEIFLEVLFHVEVGSPRTWFLLAPLCIGGKSLRLLRPSRSPQTGNTSPPGPSGTCPGADAMTTAWGSPVLGRDLLATGLSSTAIVDSLENCLTGVVLPEPITDFP